MGIQLGSVAPVGFDDFADPQWLGALRALGCTTAQVYRNRNGNDGAHTWPVTLTQIREYLAAAQMPCDSLHGVYGSDLDPSSPDEAFRKSTVAAFKAEGEMACELGGPLVVVHCSAIYANGVAPSERAIRLMQFRRTVEELARFGEGIGVRYAFENLPGYHPIGNDVAELAGVLNHVDHPNAGMCFDIAHANLVGDPVEAIAHTDGRIFYIHMCDNHGEKDDHLMPFHGNIDWAAVARAIARENFNGVIMLESFRPLAELRRLRDDGYAEQLARFRALAEGRNGAD
jgi:sugar phosphate isomerase/epimerase